MSYYSLIPHVYPLWIRISLILCAVLFLYSLKDFPYYFTLNNQVIQAREAFDRENYGDASVYYAELCQLLPSNKHMKLYLAQSLFKSDSFKDHLVALHSLENVTISNNEWHELLNYMPERYVDHFQNVKKDKA